jgi:hypothetical protein
LLPPGAGGGTRRWIWRAVLGCAIGGLAATGLLATQHGTQAAACTETWVGGVDTNFSTAGNWSPAVVPGATDDVCITATTSTIPKAAADTYTVTLNGSFSIRSLTLGAPNGTQTLLLPAGNDQLTLNAASTINANGVLTLGDAGTGSSVLCCAGINLTNVGHLNTVTGGGGSRYFRLNVTNGPGGTVDIAAPTLQDGMGGGSTRTTNNGTFTVEASGSLAIGGGGNPQYFDNTGGGISNLGTLSLTSATFTQRAGTTTGNAIEFDNSSALDDDTSAGAGNFKMASATQTLTGSGANPGIAAGQTVTISSSNETTNLGTIDYTNAGTIVMGDAGSGPATLCCAGQHLTSTGHFNTVAGGGGSRYLHVDLINNGSVDIGAPTLEDGAGGGTDRVHQQWHGHHRRREGAIPEWQLNVQSRIRSHLCHHH